MQSGFVQEYWLCCIAEVKSYEYNKCHNWGSEEGEIRKGESEGGSARPDDRSAGSGD